jgi:hypothetical protein
MAKTIVGAVIGAGLCAAILVAVVMDNSAESAGNDCDMVRSATARDELAARIVTPADASRYPMRVVSPATGCKQ